MAGLPDLVAGAVRIQQFRYKRTGADPGGIGFHYAYHMVDEPGTDAAAYAGVTRRGIGTGHVGIRTVVNVQEGCLGPFKQNFFILGKEFVQNHAGIRYIRTQFLRVFQIFLQHRFVIKRLCPINFRNDLIFRSQVDFQFFREHFRVHQVADADAHPGYLVHVAGSDAAPGRADFILAQSFFLQHIQLLVIGQHHVSPVADGDAADVHTLVVHLFDFLQHHAGVDYHAVAQHAYLPVI